MDALRGEYEYLKAKLSRIEDKRDHSATEESKAVTNQKHHSESSSTESDGDESDGTLPPLPENKKGVNRKGRTSVSAEAFGSWNKKSDFQAVVVQKNENTKDKIRERLSKSFLFNSLDK